MIIPAIDLIEGQVVRLQKGDFAKKTVFEGSALEKITQAASQGARLMHIVDLDGAKNPQKRQLDLIASLIEKSPIPIQTGGGIREEDEVSQLLSLGVSRVVAGSVLVKNQDLTRQWLKKFGPEHITLALDVRIINGIAKVAVHGWQELSDFTLEDLLDQYVTYGLRHVLITDIDRDGMMQGPNIKLYQSIAASYPHLDIIASGGMSSLDDVRAVAKTGAGAVVLGRALLEGRFTVREAVSCWQSA